MVKVNRLTRVRVSERERSALPVREYTWASYVLHTESESIQP
jgi:hypothetical protein